MYLLADLEENPSDKEEFSVSYSALFCFIVVHMWTGKSFPRDTYKSTAK